jgi:hypothetical protein
MNATDAAWLVTDDLVVVQGNDGYQYGLVYSTTTDGKHINVKLLPHGPVVPYHRDDVANPPELNEVV